ncbi:MAG: DUF4838 domain-containing protein, partial [Planctomycetota bacterium]|nr:DUF4838 domain-containing protein [Planctomycetota bacterium]
MSVSNKANFLWIAVSMAATAGAFPSIWAEESLTLVREGEDASVIVLAEKPTRSAQLAAKELQHHVLLITGCKIAIVNEGTPLEGRTPLYVGDSESTHKLDLNDTEFKEQEHLVKVTSEYAVMIGHDWPDYGPISYEESGGWPGLDFGSPDFKVGTLYAVYDFLESLCNVRWYMVTELGTAYPIMKTLFVGTAERRKTPAMTYRRIGDRGWASPGTFGRPDGMGYVRNSNYGNARDGLLYALRTRQNGSTFHFGTHTLRMYNQKIGEAHPDWFVEGKPGPNVQLRLWKDEVVKQVSRDIVEYLNLPFAERAKPNPDFPIGLGDVCKVAPLDNRDFGDDCVPPRQLNRKGGFGDGQYSNYWFTFVNRVARKVREAHPDCWIASPAYASHFEPPEFELEPNVGIYMANTEGWTDDSYGLRTLAEWRKKAKRVFVYDYWYSKAQFPAVRPHEVAAYVRKQAEVGAEGMSMEMISNSNAVAYHLDYYVTMRMLFDRELEVDNILDDYYRMFYGPAEQPMREFWTAMESYRAKLSELGIGNKLWFVVSQTNIMGTLEKHLATAETLAAEEPCTSRVKVVRTGVIDMMKERIKFAQMVEDARVPEVNVAKTALKPVFDGKLDDDAWKQAAELSPFYRQVGGHGWRTPLTQRVTAPCPETKVKILWDDENLYLGFLLLENRMDKQNLNQKHSSPGLCTDDSLEVLIDVGRQRNKEDYAQIMMNALRVTWHQ